MVSPPVSAWLALLAACVLGLWQSSAAAETAWPGTDRFIGHLASDRLGEAEKSFFELPGLALRLPHLLGAETVAQFQTYASAGAIELYDHFLVVPGCPGGDCRSGSALLILDRNSENAWFIMQRQAGGETERCWTGTQPLSTLPQTLQTPLP